MILSFFCLLFFLTFPASRALTPQSQIDGLEYLFNSTNGTNWRWKNDFRGVRWSFASPQSDPCSDMNQTWQGITCSSNPSVCKSQNCEIISLVLNIFRLVGTLPSEFFLRLTSLKTLQISNSRQLTGSLPSELALLSRLDYLSLYSNRLTGSIPELGSLFQLNYLYLYENRLTGSIPLQLGSLSQLYDFDLSDNQLTGTIPTELGSMSQLNSFLISTNLLTGSIPSELGSLVQVKSFALEFNQLTGGIPSELSSLSRLNYLDLSGNRLSGSIPPSFASAFLDLITLRLFQNSLSGQIPSEIGFLTSLDELDFSQNALTGSIPSSIDLLRNLIRLRFYQNHLDGEIVFLIHSFPSLQQLFLQQNQFHGTLHRLLSSSTNAPSSISNHSLANLDVSDNRFSGSIPFQLFLLPRLQSLSLSLNCFEHKLPPSMCEARSVEVISMSGLGSSQDCKNLVKVPFTSVSLVQTMDGNIPDCVWQLSNVRIMNLAGNGLSGTIGKVSSMSSLLSLTLSHNYLTGMIPVWLQEKNMSQLDLSHNKLTGTVDAMKNQAEILNYELINLFLGSNFPQTLKLSVNRLSGDLPHSSFKKFATLDILSGNLFGCDHIPSNDENREWTICGSDELDRSLIAMGGMCGLIGLCAMFYCLCLLFSSLSSIFMRDKSRFHWFETKLLEMNRMVRHSRYYHHYLSASHSFLAIKSFGSILSNLSLSICLFTVIFVTLSFPLYVLRVLDVDSDEDGDEVETKYMTHSHMYRWLWTMTFMAGTLPSALLLIVTLLCLMFLCLILNLLEVQGQNDSVGRVSKITKYNDGVSELGNGLKTQSELLASAVWMILILNIAVVGTVNGLYLWSTLLDLSVSHRFLIQVSFGLFTFAWRILILRGGLSVHLKESRYGVWLFTWINILNIIIIPCLATALSNPSCYQVSPQIISLRSP
jgi:Leucine-rich repeat (LRR) protein